MVKPPVSLQKRASEYKSHGLEASKSKTKLFCKFCNEDIAFEKKSTIENHLKSTGHVRRSAIAGKQPDIGKTLSTQTEKKNIFKDMASVFTGAGIPLHVFRNSHFRAWMTQNLKLGESLPAESTLRNYLTECGENDISQTKTLCAGKDVLLMADETQDFKNRKVLNILVAPAGANREFRLLHTEILAKCNAEVVVQKLLVAIQKIEVTVDRVICFLSDNARYMLLAGKLLNSLNSRCIHSTCWAHILHLVSEEIRSSMKEADRFISQVKASLVKAPSRRQELLEALEESNCEVRLPPTPVLTRWTTWLEAGAYHNKNFNALAMWIQQTEPDSAAVRELQELVQQPVLKKDLCLIADVFPGISQTIKSLEGMNLPASEVYTMIASLKDLIEIKLGTGSGKLEKYWSGRMAHPAIDFWRAVQILDPRKFALNPVMEIPECLLKFSKVPVPSLEFAMYRSLCTQIGNAAQITVTSFWISHEREMPTLSQLALSALSVPASSAEVERSFSTLKRIFRPDRNRMTEENLGIHLRMVFNGKKGESYAEELSDDEEDE